ncbi:CopD family protein [Candidatus Fermentibacteria bacterium]|nr:CopD family protein [Candidatus Fermentibacteria bacterium]
MKTGLVCIGALLLLSPLFWGNDSCMATEDFAARTGKACAFCHETPNGGPLHHVGIAYIRNSYRYPIPERVLAKSARLGEPKSRTIRLIFGYLHLVAACLLVGTMFYVHAFVKPCSLKGGIPRGERILGLICLALLLATGIHLTWYRLDSFAAFFQSTFGTLLFVKLVLFACMLVSALIAVTVVHRRMRREASAPPSSHTGFARGDLPSYDGQDGRPAYVLFRDVVYDVTNSPKWKDGGHFRKHGAGRDLTKAIEGAPHGDEVFAGMPVIARGVAEAHPPHEDEAMSRVRKVFVGMAYGNSAAAFFILLCVASWRWGFPIRVAPTDHTRRAAVAHSCVECHQKEKPGIYADWRGSMHAAVGVDCVDCHGLRDATDPVVSAAHLKNSATPVSALVTPRRCAQCHQDEVEQYGRSKHAHTLEIIGTIDKWIIHGMNNEIERTTGCYACHGTVVQFAGGTAAEGSWPNVGVGRANPDGSLGSCTSCHTRHRFSIIEARKPEACGQCHLGPDHPQIEIYTESKHGAIYHAEGDGWNWRPDDAQWRAGRDYRAPTCAGCHMSEAPTVSTSHDVTERLAWELQAPLTVRPSEFAAFPAKTSWEAEREKMRQVCLQCHSEGWTSGHFRNLDRLIEHYNTDYYEPVHRELTRLYASGLLSEESYFDEDLEWEFYEFWHHEGRRARMGAAMMAPDYAWWHGFYETKHRYLTFMEEAARLRTHASPAHRHLDFPGRHPAK